jgi:hypothetical protein
MIYSLLATFGLDKTAWTDYFAPRPASFRRFSSLSKFDRISIGEGVAGQRCRGISPFGGVLRR